MAAVILRTCSILCLFVLTRAIPSTFGGSTVQSSESGAAVPTNIATSAEGNELGAVSFKEAQKGSTMTSTVRVSKRLDTLNTTVEDLKNKLAGDGQCDCSATTATTANANGIRTLRNAVTTLKETCAEQQSGIQRMSTTVGQLTDSASTHDYSVQFSEISDILEGLSTDIGSVGAKLQDASKKGVSSGDLKKARSDVSTLTDSVQELKGKVSSCTTQCSTVAETEQSIAKQHEKLQTTIDELSGRITTIESGASAIKDKFKTIEASLASMDQAVNTAVETASSSTRSVQSSLESRLEKAESEITTLRSTVETAMNDVNYLKDDVEKAKQQIATVQETTDKAQATQDKTFERFRTSLDALRSQLSGIGGSATNYDGEIQTISKNLGMLETTAGKVQTSINSLSKKIDSISSDLASTKNDMGKLDFSNGINALKNDVDKLDSRAAAIEKELTCDCPSPFKRKYGICYYLNLVKYTWVQANIMCQAVGGEKARLAIIKDTTQLNAYQRILKSHGRSIFWVGLYTSSYSYYSGPKWTWGRGYTWKNGMPWNSGEQYVYGNSCGALQDKTGVGYYHKLSSFMCPSDYYFYYSICEYPQ